MIGIYKITSPNKRIYIGQSINIEKRFYDYNRLNCKGQKILYASFLKYGVDNHNFEIVCECLESELNDKERFYQDLYSVITKNGLNCVLVKTNDRSGKLCNETKQKMSLARLKVPKKSLETRLKHSQSLKKNEFNNNKLRLLNESKKKKIGVFDYNSQKKLYEFESIRECSRVLGYDRKSISLSCRNIYPYAYGLTFKFL